MQIIRDIMLAEEARALAMLVVVVPGQDKRLLARLVATVLLIVLLAQVHIMVEVVVAQVKAVVVAQVA
jgi:hypothetical protein